MNNKIVHIIGGGTVSHIRTHCALSAPAYGGTARKLARLCKEHNTTMDIQLHLTKMADSMSTIETNDDLKNLILDITKDMRTKIVFFNPAVADFDGVVGDVQSGKSAKRLISKEAEHIELKLTQSPKLVSLFRNGGESYIQRKDIFLVAFKATSGETEEEQYKQGLNLLKASSANLVLANDVVTNVNMIIVPEEAAYHVTTNRDESLTALVEMAYLRSHLTFTRSTIIAGDPVPWNSELIPASLRTIVDHCISRGAYKKFRGVTAGHFAVKLDEQTFLTSRRKTDFNDMKHVGLVKVKTDGPDSVVAYGSKPSVGGQSQRIVFSEHRDTDCVVHFHCPKKVGSLVPTVSQREFECGSHECGKNTSTHLTRFGNLLAVHLDNHGPNIVFNKNIDPNEVITFIEDNFDLTEKTGGYRVE